MPIHHRFFPEHSLLSLVWEGSLEQAEILHASDKWLESLGDADGVQARRATEWHQHEVAWVCAFLEQ